MSYDARQRDARLLRCLACWRAYWVSGGGWKRYRPYGRQIYICEDCVRNGVPEWAVQASERHRRRH